MEMWFKQFIREVSRIYLNKKTKYIQIEENRQWNVINLKYIKVYGEKASIERENEN